MSDTTTAPLFVKLEKLISQYELTDESHARSGCGITCLWMVLNHLDPNFTITLHDFNSKERNNRNHFDQVNGLWLQQGSAECARTNGLKAMAVNLYAMGDSDTDLASMYHSGRISHNETYDYLDLFNEIQPLKDMKQRLKVVLKYGLSKNSPVMLGVKAGHGDHKQTHRLICVGCNEDTVKLVDPLNYPAAIVEEPLERLFEYMTGNILLVYV